MISFRETLCQNKQLTLMGIHNAMVLVSPSGLVFEPCGPPVSKYLLRTECPHASFLGIEMFARFHDAVMS